MTRYVFFLLFLLNQINSYSQIVVKNALYSIEKFENLDENGDYESYYLKYNFSKDGYNLVIDYYKNNNIRSIIGYNDQYSFETDFELDTCGRIMSLEYKAFKVEAGPAISFYNNGLIKSYFNYGFKKKDIGLKIRWRKIKSEIPNAAGMMNISEIPYYKEKNGIEYLFDDRGNIIGQNYYKNGNIVK